MALASTVWDANLYLKFADARMRPALDLMGRLDPANAARPGHAIYDLGCGAGNISRICADRRDGAPGGRIAARWDGATRVAVGGPRRDRRLDARSPDGTADDPAGRVVLTVAGAGVGTTPRSPAARQPRR